MKTNEDLTMIRALVSLKNGILVWLPREPAGSSIGAANIRRWNARYAGLPVRLEPHIKGYLRLRLKRRWIFAHRLIWALHYGHWPTGILDHINGDKTDNLIGNLREVTPLENARNRPLHKRNTTGVSGVSDRPYGYAALIGNGGKPLHLGTFQTFEEAVAARRKAERQLGYHPNHGRTT